MWIIAINGEEPIKAQGAINELNRHKSLGVKSKVKISIFKRKSYHRTDLEDIFSIFYQIRPVVLNIEVFSFRMLALNVQSYTDCINLCTKGG